MSPILPSQNEQFPSSPPNLLLYLYPSHSKMAPSFQQFRSKFLKSASTPHFVSHQSSHITNLVGFAFKVYLRSEYFSQSALLPFESGLLNTRQGPRRYFKINKSRSCHSFAKNLSMSLYLRVKSRFLVVQGRRGVLGISP